MYICIYVVSIFCFSAYLIFTHLANLHNCSIQPCLSFQIPMVYMLSFCIWCICVSLCRADRTVHLVQWRKRRLTPPTLPMSSSMQTAPDNIFVTQIQIQIQKQTQANTHTWHWQCQVQCILQLLLHPTENCVYKYKYKYKHSEPFATWESSSDTGKFKFNATQSTLQPDHMIVNM